MKKTVNDVQMTPVRTSGGNFLDHSSSSFRQRLQQLGQERADPRSNRVSWVMAWEKTYEPAVGLPAICVRRYQTRRARIWGGPGYRHFICLHSRSAEESSANKAINSGPANRMNFRLLGKSGLKRFLIVALLSTFALLSPIVSLAQQPTTMSAKSGANPEMFVPEMTTSATFSCKFPTPCQPMNKLPFSPGLTLGDTLYVSGHLGVDPAVGKAPDDPEEEARQVLHSVELRLKEAGMSMDDFVNVEIYCTDLN